MNIILTYTIIILVIIIVSWMLLGRIQNHHIRILLRSAFLAFFLSPTYYFNGEHIIFTPALGALITSLSCMFKRDIFIAATVSMAITWLLFVIIGFFFHKQKHAGTKNT